MVFNGFWKNRQEYKRFSYFRMSIIADIDYLMGFVGDEKFIRQICQKYPAIEKIIEEEFRKDISVQLAGLTGLGRNVSDIPDGPRRRQMTQKTVAVNLVGGIISLELSNLSDGARTKVSQELEALIPGHPFTSGLTMTDVGGGNVVQLAGETIRQLRNTQNNTTSSAVSGKLFHNVEVAWFLRSSHTHEATIAMILISSTFIAHRWAQHKLINIETSEYKHLGELLTAMSNATGAGR